MLQTLTDKFTLTLEQNRFLARKNIVKVIHSRSRTEKVNATLIVWIDGQKLAEYVHHYGLGVQVEQTLSIKKLDNDFWDSMPNDETLSFLSC